MDCERGPAACCSASSWGRRRRKSLTTRACPSRSSRSSTTRRATAKAGASAWPSRRARTSPRPGRWRRPRGPGETPLSFGVPIACSGGSIVAASPEDRRPRAESAPPAHRRGPRPAPWWPPLPVCCRRGRHGGVPTCTRPSTAREIWKRDTFKGRSSSPCEPPSVTRRGADRGEMVEHLRSRTRPSGSHSSGVSNGLPGH